ncbi:cytochrome C [Nakamurella antarctica]|uniref:Cytochrome bc1 complex cytochrome c subunit n=1 Tax=Nakamurella antarctica TaxID=1902245 RepID=A0A3G8ZKP9_9ACTN|nr:cytochrome c [Nakamurella antarctica]AZI57780.1 cytochrome C [Nakamurella antarctica]
MTTPQVPTTGRRRTVKRGKSRLFRRVSGGLALLFALTTVGFVYSAFTPNPTAAEANAIDPVLIAQGQKLYDTSCITCHGANLQGVVDRGPSLIGVGQAATYFQVATGRMPVADNGAQVPRKQPSYTEAETEALGAYIQATGGGPVIPNMSLQNTADVAKGAELYRLNCASCHNFTGKGGALSQGKYAPDLGKATDKEIWAAMISGPQNMPKFSDAQLTPDEKVAIITYVQNAKTTMDAGGYGLGGFGPVSEGFFAFLIGMGLIVSVTLWMGARA